MKNITESMPFSTPKSIEFNPDLFQLPLNPTRGMINEKIQAHVAKSTTDFYDRILAWIDSFAKEQGMSLDDLNDAGYGLSWEGDGSVSFVRVKDGKVTRVKGFRLEIATNVTIPFIGNVS